MKFKEYINEMKFKENEIVRIKKQHQHTIYDEDTFKVQRVRGKSVILKNIDSPEQKPFDISILQLELVK